MKKKILLVLVLMVVLLTGCSKKEKEEKTYGENSAALSFKETYEALNDTMSTSKKENRNITIPEDNPYITVDAKTIVEMIENKETFYVYFGFPSCPWCRSVLEVATEKAKDLAIDKIYYVNIYSIRDTYKLEKDKLIKESDGTEDYNKLLKLLDNVLDAYTLKDSKGNVVDTGEKRIYAPNFVWVENGKAKRLVTGISEKQTDPRMKLSDEILEDERKIFSNFFIVVEAN